ncbi:MAG: HEAT repeat domain-containing protein [Gemmataceae bacterium]|nr:HEAT repeat domain-containing protein [Gemmataceae bacterium]MCS7269715.1 HEAT repeat domain-containing protein [Gemmataceae bacterium]MDW8241832.1 HEAT repeat domain-containing protein [Thermogemmata sp.]
MPRQDVMRVVLGGWLLFAGLVYLGTLPESLWAAQVKEAKKYTEQLKSARTPKEKVVALQELGRLAAIQKSLVVEALPHIYKALEDKDPEVRGAAAHCLGQCDEPPEKAVPLLHNLLKDEKQPEVVRIGAARGLAAMGAQAKVALPTLRSIAKNADKKDRLGKEAQQAAKAIVSLLKDSK